MVTDDALRRAVLQVTVLLLFAGGLLIVLGTAGVGASLPLVAGLLALAGALYAARPEERPVGTVLRVDVDAILARLWLAPIVGVVPLVVELGATPAEVQALGGLIGLLGMANYFLRPLYFIGLDLVRPVVRRTDHR